MDRRPTMRWRESGRECLFRRVGREGKKGGEWEGEGEIVRGGYRRREREGRE